LSESVHEIMQILVYRDGVTVWKQCHDQHASNTGSDTLTCDLTRPKSLTWWPVTRFHFWLKVAVNHRLRYQSVMYGSKTLDGQTMILYTRKHWEHPLSKYRTLQLSGSKSRLLNAESTVHC